MNKTKNKCSLKKTLESLSSYIYLFIFTLKAYWLRDNKNTLKTSLLLPDPVRETKAEGGGPVNICMNKTKKYILFEVKKTL